MPVPPFHSNPDDTHCLPCCLRMGFEHFQPEKQWNWPDIDCLIGKVEGRYSWFMRTYIETAVLGYEVIGYDTVDYADFGADPEAYLRQKFSAERAKDMIANSDMDRVARDIQALQGVDGIDLRCRNYEAADMKALLDEGFLLLAMVDEAILHGLEGRTISHAVLVHGYDEDGLILHDPGVESLGTARASLHVPYDLYRQASVMNDRGETGKLMAFKTIGDRDHV